MKRINIYITEDTDKQIDALSELLQINRSEIMRQSIELFSESYQTDIKAFIDGLDFSDDEDKPQVINEQLKSCIDDPEYFLEHAVHINTADHGIQKLSMYDFQKQLLFKLDTYNKLILNTSRQAGTNTIVLSYVLHYCLSHPNARVLLASSKLAMAIEMLEKIDTMQSHLPSYIKSSFRCINNIKRNMEFSNGSSISVTSTASPASIRGASYDFVLLNNFAFTPVSSVYEMMVNIDVMKKDNPNMKLIIESSPNGVNYFYKLWADAITNFNNYHAVKLPWTLIPYRDDEWKQLMIKTIGYDNFMQEYECSFNEGLKGDLYAN